MQELNAERKRSSAAEFRAKKVTERANELEDRLKTAIADLEEMRQDKVLRSRKSGEALANKVRAKLARSEDGDSGHDRPSLAGAPGAAVSGDAHKNVETAELLKLVENLVTENNILRSESMELHGLLESTREEQLELRSAMADQDVVPEEDEEEVRRAENDEDCGPNRFEQRRLSMFSTTSAPPDHLASPSLSQGGFDLDSHRAPLSPGSSVSQRPWGASPFSGAHANDHDRSFPLDSEMQLANRPPTAVKRSNSLRGRRPPPVSSNSTGALNTAKVPFGRSKGHARRSLSMDISSSVQSGQGVSSRVPFSFVSVFRLMLIRRTLVDSLHLSLKATLLTRRTLTILHRHGQRRSFLTRARMRIVQLALAATTVPSRSRSDLLSFPMFQRTIFLRQDPSRPSPVARRPRTADARLKPRSSIRTRWPTRWLRTSRDSGSPRQ